MIGEQLNLLSGSASFTLSLGPLEVVSYLEEVFEVSYSGGLRLYSHILGG